MDSIVARALDVADFINGIDPKRTLRGEIASHALRRLGNSYPAQAQPSAGEM